MKNNSIRLLSDFNKDFEYLTQDIDDIFGKPWLKTSIKSNMAEMNKDVPREIINNYVDLLFLIDHS